MLDECCDMILCSNSSSSHLRVTIFVVRYDKDVSAVSRGLCLANLTQEFWFVTLGCLLLLSRRVSSRWNSPLVAGDVICVAPANVYV